VDTRWDLFHQDEDRRRLLSKTLNINPLTAQVLINRGIADPEEAEAFLSPSLGRLVSPNLLKGMNKGVKRIYEAIVNSQKITIYGDYDVDGSTSTALLLLFFRETGAICDYYIPHRIKEGYGLNRDSVEKIAGSGTKVIITVDNGITAVDEAALVSSLEMDLIITDHHQPPPELPEAYAIINPLQDGCSYPFKGLSGAGIAFHLIIALRSYLRDKGFWKDKKEPNLKKYLDLVALATIADIVPLKGVNRTLTVFGLKELSKGGRRGIDALKKVSSVDEDDISVGAVAFHMAPRLNAAGRLSVADTGVKLLVCEDEQTCINLALNLDLENRERQKIEAGILLEAVKMVEMRDGPPPSSLVLASRGWHAGVIGIVASRLVEKFYRPTIVISVEDGVGKGSARSIAGFDLYESLNACSEYLIKFGGHKYAAGLSIEPSRIADFTEAFEKEVNSRLESDDFRPLLKIDSIVELDGFEDKLIEELESLAPFGTANAEPLFASEKVGVERVSLLKDRHLRMTLGQGKKSFSAIAFNMANKDVKQGDLISIAFSPQFNLWKGRKTIQLKIRDIKKNSQDTLQQYRGNRK